MTTDLNKLIAEAKEQTYDPRAKKCWPWWHAWTMWGHVSVRQQGRRCVRCGLEQRRALAHACVWVTDRRRDFTTDNGGSVIGMVYYQRCDGCGDVRRLECAQ